MIEKKYQTFWRRFWAGWVDSLVLLPLYFLDMFIWENHEYFSVVLLLFWYTAYSLSYMVYSILMHGKLGQTLGKMATRVKVVNISENKLSMSQAIKRDAVPLSLTIIAIALEAQKILSGANIYDPKSFEFDASFYLTMLSSLGWFAAEVITMLFNNKRRALHDYIAGSVVICLPKIGGK
jgi:uncharacterized RDD family membrane protein YckC